MQARSRYNSNPRSPRPANDQTCLEESDNFPELDSLLDPAFEQFRREVASQDYIARRRKTRSASMFS